MTIKEVKRYAVMVYTEKHWTLLGEDGTLSRYHKPKTWTDKETAVKAGSKYTGANIVEWNGR